MRERRSRWSWRKVAMHEKNGTAPQYIKASATARWWSIPGIDYDLRSKVKN